MSTRISHISPPSTRLWRTPDGKRYASINPISPDDAEICDERTGGEIGYCARSEQLEAISMLVDSLADQVGVGSAELLRCKDKVDRDMSETKSAIHELRGDVAALKGDVHQITASVSGIQQSLAQIADATSKLADLPETWGKIKGFWAVLRWLRENILLLALLAAFVAWVTGAGMPAWLAIG